MRYLVDTNIWIAFLKRHAKVRAWLRETLAQGHEIYVVPIVYFELLCGLEKRQDFGHLSNSS